MTDILCALKWQSPLLDIIRLQDVFTERGTRMFGMEGWGEARLTGLCAWVDGWTDSWRCWTFFSFLFASYRSVILAFLARVGNLKWELKGSFNKLPGKAYLSTLLQCNDFFFFAWTLLQIPVFLQLMGLINELQPADSIRLIVFVPACSSLAQWCTRCRDWFIF